jgi:hypothetical protein
LSRDCSETRERKSKDYMENRSYVKTIDSSRKIRSIWRRETIESMKSRVAGQARGRGGRIKGGRQEQGTWLDQGRETRGNKSACKQVNRAEFIR